MENEKDAACRINFDNISVYIHAESLFNTYKTI